MHGNAAANRMPTRFNAKRKGVGMDQPLITDPVSLAAAYLFYLCRNLAGFEKKLPVGGEALETRA
jgi:hypothetical protein